MGNSDSASRLASLPSRAAAAQAPAVAVSTFSITQLSGELARFRFMRAWSGAGAAILYLPLVLLPLALIAHVFLLIRVFSSSPEAAERLAPVGSLFYGYYGIVAFTVVFFVVADIVSRLYRRLVGLLGFLLSAAGVLLGVLALGMFLWAPYEADIVPFEASGVIAFAVVAVQIGALIFSGIVGAELGLYFAWLAVAPHSEYVTVRGWRPPFWRVLANVRRAWGLPAFLSALRTRRGVLTTLYYVIAVLNLPFFIAIFLPGLLIQIAATPPFFRTFGLIMFAPIFVAMAATLLLWAFGVGQVAASAARRRATEAYQSVREWDKRQPIVFLRSFKSDAAPLEVRTANPVLTAPGGLGGTRTLDELLLEHGSPYGPVIAIGDPSQPLPPLGAARVFVKDESWQSVVQALTDASQSIVICPNRTPGVAWELNLVGSGERLAKTIFLRDPALPSGEAAASLIAYLPGGAGARANARRGEVEVALFADPVRGWTLLTCRNPSCHAYEVALKHALYRRTGVLQVPLPPVE